MTTIAAMMTADYGVMGDILRLRAAEAPVHPAVIMETGEAVTYAQFDALADRVAAALQRDGIKQGEAVAVCALSSISYAALFLGALRAGVAVAPLAPSSTPEAIAGMVADCGARLFFMDAGVAEAQKAAPIAVRHIALDGSDFGQAFDRRDADLRSGSDEKVFRAHALAIRELDGVRIDKAGVGANQVELARPERAHAILGEFRDDLFLARVDGLHVGARGGNFQAEGLSFLCEVQDLGHVEQRL